MFDRRLNLAPMMDYTDRHYRYFLRLLSSKVVLYTEMLTTGALLHHDPARWLQFDPAEHPIALQLGGNNPTDLAACAKLAEEFAYDEINLNVGCPSDRVQSGCFGAALMAQPSLVAECVAAMCAAVRVPITVKTRIGIDEQDSYAELQAFISTVAAAGCDVFIMHARKAWLQGLSPKQNRQIPPLRYEVVHQLKKDFPHLTIIINGGIKTTHEALTQLKEVDGIMIGREAYHNPYLLAHLQHLLEGDPLPERSLIIERLLPYVTQQLAEGVRLSQISRHLLGLFQGLAGARQWRRYLTEQARTPAADAQVLIHALDYVL